MSFRALQMGTAHLERAQQFWTKTMGLEELSSGPDSVTLAAGATHWTLTQAQTPPAIAHFAFTIPENLFDEAVAWLREHAPLLSGSDGKELFDFSHWNAHAVYFTDPDGNIAELIARHTLPNSRRENFEILGISEIGLVTDDVPGTVASLGLPLYRQGGTQFQPVGDEEGLLIVVQHNRPWYPDNRHPAQPIPLTVTLMDGQMITTGPPIGELVPAFYPVA
ncbi:VOC family protein [Armatimonas sp.]|uniref:VOC family protein n=1 Tax=Armatimonas sp. TaxID=1872638 RepID=UPI00375385B0